MTVSLKHKFVSAIPDGPDATIVRPSNWNDEHELLVAQGKLIGRFSSGTGAAEEITIGSGLSYTGGTLVVTSVGSGTVTSVDVSGSTTGLTFTGGPITTAGTITLGGTLGIGYGGTGGTTAATARANLSAAVLGANGDITSLTGLTGGISTPTFLQFNTATTPTAAVGQLSWNQADGTLNLGMLGGNVTLQVGEEMLVRVVNKSGTALTDGQVVYLSGAQGNRVKVDLAIANGSSAIARTVLGVVTEAIPNNQEGFVTLGGLVRDLNTSAYVDGDILYLSSTVAGGITNVRPTAPIHVVIVGYCVNANPSVGSIFVSVQPGYDLEDLSDVAVTTPAAGQLLIYNNASQTWVNNTITAGSGIAITNGNGTISIATSGLGTMSTQNANAVAITGGAIDGTTVGATTRSTGAFTSLAYNTTLTGGTGIVALGTSQFYKDASGNVGIGTASPSTLAAGSKLVVYNAGFAAMSIVSDGSSNTQLRFDNTLGAYLNNLSNTPMLFYNNATEKMRLDATGNLGIGVVPSGTYKLEVLGTLNATTIAATRINPRIGTVASSATITPTGDASDQYNVTALATGATIAIPSGTPVDGQKLTLRIKDNGTARALTWTTSAGGYRIIGAVLPTTTVISKTVYVGCVYNAADSFWDVLAVAQQA